MSCKCSDQDVCKRESVCNGGCLDCLDIHMNLSREEVLALRDNFQRMTAEKKAAAEMIESMGAETNTMRLRILSLEGSYIYLNDRYEKALYKNLQQHKRIDEL